MKNKFSGTIAVLAIVSVACNSSTQKGTADNVITVKFETAKQIKPVITNTIFLETTDSALIGQNYIFKVVSHYYIFGDNKKIIIFTKQGKINGVINAIGNGPNETSSVHYFYANDKSILVMAIGKKQILEFNFKGEFIKAHSLEDHSLRFACFDNYYLFDNQSKATERGNVLSISDRQGKIVKDTIPVIAEGIDYGKNKFQELDEYFLYLPTMSNIIYKIDKKNNVSSAYELDFGNHWLNAKGSNEVVANSNGDVFALWKYLKNNDKIGFLSFFDTKNWLFLNFEKQDKSYNWYYNKTNKNQYMIECNSLYENLVEIRNINGVDKNRFLAVVPADSYSKLTDRRPTELSEEDNPVIIEFELE